MNDVVIRAHALGKRYLIGHHSVERERYTALRDVIGRSLKGLGRSAFDMMRGRPVVTGDEIEEFWALKEVNFEIRRGEVVGIIGRNGAGKSTLLKILSRITEPSAGQVAIKGRVASLLEVGTGFHPELTGRENIYLNGAILGMGRSEIRRKFDAIVEFAGTERFLDTPVKRYSSGMYVRLAFAVAAHLEPEILVVDEVLAVGDAEFQKKCLGKLQDVASDGRTILFVSHNLNAVTQFCSRGILLLNGRVDYDGSALTAVQKYTAEGSKSAPTSNGEIPKSISRRGSGEAQFTHCVILNQEERATYSVRSHDSLSITLHVAVRRAIPALKLTVLILSGSSRDVVTSVAKWISETEVPKETTYKSTFRIPSLNLRPGEYELYLWLGSSSIHFYDVLDCVVGPLTVSAPDGLSGLSYDPVQPTGYFDLDFSADTVLDQQ